MEVLQMAQKKLRYRGIDVNQEDHRTVVVTIEEEENPGKGTNHFVFLRFSDLVLGEQNIELNAVGICGSSPCSGEWLEGSMAVQNEMGITTDFLWQPGKRMNQRAICNDQNDLAKLLDVIPDRVLGHLLNMFSDAYLENYKGSTNSWIKALTPLITKLSNADLLTNEQFENTGNTGIY
jgi:hypothetical protein